MHARRAAATAALLLSIVAAGCGGADAPDPAHGGSPTARDVPSGDQVVALPGAEVHLDLFATNDDGDLLSAVIVPRGSDVTEWCAPPSPAALVWNGHDGGRRTWTGEVMARMIAPAEGGFVVGAVRPDCVPSRSGPETDPDAYLITASGETVDVRWPAGAEGERARGLCAQNPREGRCRFSAVDGSVRVSDPVTDPARPPGRTVPIWKVNDLELARSADSRVLWWSADSGSSWQHRETALPPGDSGIELVLDRQLIGFTNGTDLEYSTDDGRTWSTRRLPLLLESLDVTDSGLLVGVVAPHHPDRWREYRVVVSSDTSWETVQPMPARAAMGPLWVEVHGDVVYVYNSPAKWWISVDAGAHWRVVEPLPRPRG